MTDDNIADACQSEQRAIVSLDLDFADIRSYSPADYSGLIVLRLDRQDRQHVVDGMMQPIPKLRYEELIGKLWIVTEKTIRICG